MNKKIVRVILTLIVIGVLGGGGYAAYIYFMPHRDVQAQKADDTLKAAELLAEFTANKETANKKYLDDEGESKILIIEGRVESITTDQNQQKVILLQEEGEKMGVSCTFMQATNKSADGVKVGDRVKVKGAITQGNGYDDLLDLYDNALLINCDIVE